MEKEIVNKEILKDIFKVTPHLLKMAAHRMLIDYDQEADVLYISFRRPQKATDSEMLDEGVLVRYRGDEVVGLTILEASKRNRKNLKRNVAH